MHKERLNKLLLVLRSVDPEKYSQDDATFCAWGHYISDDARRQDFHDFIEANRAEPFSRASYFGLTFDQDWKIFGLNCFGEERTLAQEIILIEKLIGPSQK